VLGVAGPRGTVLAVGRWLELQLDIATMDGRMLALLMAAAVAAVPAFLMWSLRTDALAAGKTVVGIGGGVLGVGVAMGRRPSASGPDARDR
jgi:hypothetical protein